MALQKEIRQEDGIVTGYHRVLFIQSTINHHTSIVVVSYVDKESRDQAVGNVQPYQITITYETEYRENITVRQAYEYLKTLPAFEDAEDVLEDISEEITGEEFLSMIEEVM